MNVIQAIDSVMSWVRLQGMTMNTWYLILIVIAVLWFIGIFKRAL